MRVGFLVGLLSFCGGAAFSQAADGTPAFEVASVKVSETPVGGGGRGGGGRQDVITPSPGGVSMSNVRLKSAIQWAYHLQTVQVSGPAWMETNRYDVMAKAAGPVSLDELRLMMQTLLAERFKLACHKETKEMPAYVVTVGKGGPKMTPSDGEGELQMRPAGNRLAVQFTHATIEQLAQMNMSPLLGIVVDQTGLKGQWNFTLDASSFALSQPAGIDDAVAMFIQAVNEQLGLKIEQKKVPAEVLIVDHAEKVPVQN